MMKRISMFVTSLVLITGCAGQSQSTSSGAQSGTNYVAGDGSVTYIAPSKRGAAISLKGVTLENKPLNVAAWRGDVVVVNFWASWCGPCRGEATTLANVYKEFAHKKVHFLGLNTRDGVAAASAFSSRFPTGYPSLQDQDGALTLSFGNLGPAATPTTIVLDQQARIAARILGPVTQAQLRGIITAVQQDATS
jgi:thiol-disulfide isomerase/thioredoxin